MMCYTSICCDFVRLMARRREHRRSRKTERTDGTMKRRRGGVLLCLALLLMLAPMLGGNAEAADAENFFEAAGIESPVTVLFNEPADCRYVRFNGLSRATQWGHSIYELELYRGIVGTAQCSLEYADGGIRLKLDGKTYSLSKSN